VGTLPLSGAACVGGQAAMRSLCVQAVGGGLKWPGDPDQWRECIRGALAWRMMSASDHAAESSADSRKKRSRQSDAGALDSVR